MSVKYKRKVGLVEKEQICNCIKISDLGKLYREILMFKIFNSEIHP